MKQKQTQCACGQPMFTRCAICNAPLCEDHTITGLDDQGKMQRRCASCDRRRQEPLPPSWWPGDVPYS